jgi:hypothetical protein
MAFFQSGESLLAQEYGAGVLEVNATEYITGKGTNTDIRGN